MRICVLAGNYTRAGETFVYEPLDWLAAAGHTVALVARRARTLPEEGERRHPDRVLGVPGPAAALLRALARAPVSSAVGLRRGWPHRDTRGFELAQGLRAAALPEIRDADALFAHFGPTGVQFLSAAFLARRPYAVYFHGYDVGRVLSESPRAYESLFRSGASLLTNCEFQRSRLVAAGAPPERVRIVPLGVDPKVTDGARSPAPRVVTIARLVPKKGLDDSLRAFARLGAATPEWRYDVVGDGPLRDPLLRLAAEEKIGERVHFHGFLAHDAALDVLRGASVFALASRTGEDGSTEGTPVALLEAAALGLPIVATQHAGIPEILPAEAAAEGFLVAEGDVQAFGDALVRLARDPSLRRDWGGACAAHVRARHSAAAHVEALVDALAQHARVPRLDGGAPARAADATAPRRLRIGVVASEFFDRAGGGRMGGFGWAAAEVARCFRDDPSLGADVFFLTGARSAQGPRETRVHDTPLLLQSDDYAERIRALAPDLLLLIDYRRGYRRALEAVPDTPFVLWSRDPWDTGDRAKVRTLRIPGAADEIPTGYGRGDDATFIEVARSAARGRRRWLLATTTPCLAAKVEDAYGVAPPRVHALPNPLPAGPAPRRAARPTVLWLGRLDAVKRPWLCVEIARRMPEVEFWMAGDAYIDGPLRWQPQDLPPNVKLRGHLEGADKEDALAQAWLLLGTAIHEGLAISFLEALAAEMPVVACQDPEGIVSRFGRCVGRFDGSGEDAVPGFVAALGELLADADLRQRLGRAGREWVDAHHSREHFLASFRALVAELGVAWPERQDRGASEHRAPRPRDLSP